MMNNKSINFNSTLFDNENSFLHAVKQITIYDIYSLDDATDSKKIFMDIALLPDEIVALQSSCIQQMKSVSKITDASFQEFDKQYHVFSVVYNWLEDIILTEKLQQIKHQIIKTKLSTTNLLLVSILETINNKGSQGESSEKIHELDMSEINEELYRYCYKMQELAYRKEQKEHEQNFLRQKAKLLQSESLLRKKHVSQYQKYKRKREALKESIHSLESQISELKKIENESILEFDIKQYESYEDYPIGNDFDRDPLVSLSNPIDDIEKLEKQLRNLKVEFKKLDSLPEVEETAYQEKLENTYKKNTEKLQILREELIKNCVVTEEAIAINKKEEETFFDQLNKKDSLFDSAWRSHLYIPVKKTTSKYDKNSLSNSNACIIDNHGDKKKKKDLIFRSLQYLEAYNILHKEPILDEKYIKYTINLEGFQKHPIQNTEVVNRLLKLLSAYLKFNSTSSVEDFWGHIDWLIEYWMQDPRLYSTVAQHELAILDAYDEKLAIKIRTKETVYRVEEFFLSFDNNMNKTVEFTAKDKTIILMLSDIVNVEIIEKNIKSDQSWTQQQQFKSHLSKYKIPDMGEFKTILMVDISHAEFFDMRPLKNQIIYKTAVEIKSFLERNGIEKVSPNKIYIEAFDTQDKIIYTVKRCIPHVKILEPTVIKERFNKIIKSMCDEI